MQIFLPYESFVRSAACLDRHRLGNQRIEAKLILQALEREEDSTPILSMWKDFECCLAVYGMIVCLEWRSRGYKDQQHPWFVEKAHEYSKESNAIIYEKPEWIGDDAFHLSHKSNLIRKLPEHYKPLWPDVPNDLELIWPLNG